VADSDLTTTAILTSELGGSVDATALARILGSASDACRSYLGRGAIHYNAAIVEKHAGKQRLRLVLERPPVASIGSISIDGSAVDSDQYEIEDADAGLIYRRDGWLFTGLLRDGIVGDALPGSEQKLITVTYAGGWVTPNQAGTRSLPFDIEEACIITAVSMYRNRGSNWHVASESLGDASVSYRPAVAALPDAARALLDPYRRLLP
jgi:hypothetical protein